MLVVLVTPTVLLVVVFGVAADAAATRWWWSFNNYMFTMELAGSDNPNMSKNYPLNTFKDFVSLEGRVEFKFDMKPHDDNFEEYGKICRERTNRSMIKKNSQIKVIGNDRGPHMRPMPGIIGLVSSNPKDNKRKPVPVKPQEIKRTQRDRGELEDIIFKLFEKQPNWTLKQLVQETDQPAHFLKEILNELLNYLLSKVESQDWPDVTKYAGLVCAQAHHQELIEDLFKIWQDPVRGAVTGGMGWSVKNPGLALSYHLFTNFAALSSGSTFYKVFKEKSTVLRNHRSYWCPALPRLPHKKIISQVHHYEVWVKFIGVYRFVV
ncbi:hypothetical protein C5167_043213 [Papaver somniferum]|uniref:TFIIF beta subunit HTH domain-containing protein n=1 Tax=Papaver somniferum TaxID=3469 RepID=A0A4Y7L8G2_PAPSO|nr:hypothetical protein C5167_043213 [Papaver somniferum]